MEQPLMLIEIGKRNKNAMMKRAVLSFFINWGYATIADVAKQMCLSVPTAAKLVEEMTAANILCERGKLETNGGRHPAVYDLNPKSCYFAGVEIKNASLSLGIIDFCGNMIDKMIDVPFVHDNTLEDLNRLCEIIITFISSASVDRSLIYNININISGRVNPKVGKSISRFNFTDEPLTSVLSRKLGMNVTIENDTRAMTMGEFKLGTEPADNNVIFVNLSWGLGIGIIIDRKLYSGKSGFAGEFGHMVTCDNEVLCHCGKKGCLETEASGSALHRKFIERMAAHENSILAKKYREQGDVSLQDLIDAVVKSEDILCIKLVDEIGMTLGRWLAGLINIFNPDKVIIGGALSATGDYLLQPIRTSVMRYSLNSVNKDTNIVLSRLGEAAGLIGACETARSRAFGNI